MATFTLRRFSRPATLRQIDPARLLAFLEQFRRYFLQRGVHIPRSLSEGDLDYDAVASVFLSPSTNTPTIMDPENWTAW
ncbi:MAG: hypothetical protein LC104_15030 [Bacteroidales bacterium]|nr:hypothetical protein [Bacteroidales bacterium]